VGYISQEPMVALDPSFRVGTLLREAVRSHSSISRAQASRRVLELLELVRLPDPEHVAKLYPFELSGGMAQRVSIARALARRPRLLIADEPTTALDVTVQSEILELLRSLQADTGMAILLVSHDWGVVAQLCRRAIVMYAGEIVEASTLDELLRAPAHPYAEALLACLPSSAPDDANRLPTIAGTVPDPESWPAACRFAPRCPYRIEGCTAGPIGLESVASDRVSRCIRSQELIAREVAGVAG
jgi:peptide/nickel transport system permease protein